MSADNAKSRYWDAEREANLRKWWCEEGLSGGRIAELLGGGISRSAVLGKVHRMRLPTRRQQFQSQKINGKQTSAFGKPFKQAPKLNPRLNGHRSPHSPKVTSEAMAVALAFKSPSPVKFEALEAHHCRWVEEQQTGTSLHCGCQVVPGTSWCKHHHMRVFRQPIVTQTMLVTSDNKPKVPENA